MAVIQAGMELDTVKTMKATVSNHARISIGRVRITMDAKKKLSAFKAVNTAYTSKTRGPKIHAVLKNGASNRVYEIVPAFKTTTYFCTIYDIVVNDTDLKFE
jgi:hypothetical protein